MLDLQEGSTKNDVLSAMDGHVLEQDTLVGRYALKQKQENTRSLETMGI